MTIRLDTTEYEAAHGCKPRGNKEWSFKFPYGPLQMTKDTFEYTGTLTKCKRDIAREFPFIQTAIVCA